ncbi:Crp/Fnr family transcriptional regulator [Flavobacterium columnare]|nr:Crp/Fnr family transcriptional regulator [Flavobacterium columnare]APT22061.1 Crp/Fnr family transcriptional regulator [Flavobacterium columnare]MBF6653423.1 Crp/Fnr family transcriptional regulator [Flavobacterium columnare]MBF6655826.1 Crp/Fnr family transcriptional regulator [Flavobacterium columnare]MBF6657961.1 Crp/Fnr family transcriptional regulator [Flavobacterium columnare]PTD14404.1 Crp/Fnr family transcriptional regulator [Flavobacterium columnare]
MKNLLFTLLNQHQLFEKTLLLKRNEYLVVNGSIDTNVYFVKDGSLKISVFNTEEQIIRFGYKGDFVACLDSFFSDKPTVFSIQAIKKTIVLKVNKNKFKALMYANIETLKVWNEVLEDLILQQLEREMDLLTVSAKERLERIQLRNPLVFQEIPHKLIANYLRMSPETLSRLKSLDVYQENLK